MTRAAPRAEAALLAALLFTVPLFEVPKHLLWLAWVAAWLVHRGPRALAAGPWRAPEIAIAAAAASVAAAGALSGAWPQSLSAGADALRNASVAWLIARGGYSARQLLALLCAAVAGALVALAWGLVELLRASGPASLELHSVGHVNHSAIYLAVAVAAASGLAVAAWARPGALRAAWTVAIVVLVTGLFVAASRAALGAAAVFFVLVGVAAPVRPAGATPGGWPRMKFRAVLAVAIAAAALGYALALHLSPHALQPSGEGVGEKFASRPADAGVLAYRDRLWHVALLAFRTQPLLGIGNGRFRTLDARGLCGAQAAGDAAPAGAGAAAGPAGGSASADPDCDPSRLYFAPHAHSVYANTLAERGALGLAALLALLAVWAAALARTRRRCPDDPAFAGVWTASLGAWCVVSLAGTLNTTLHHEHGMLAMAALGALVAAARGERP